jgi:hypothetical protein
LLFLFATLASAELFQLQVYSAVNSLSPLGDLAVGGFYSGVDSFIWRREGDTFTRLGGRGATAVTSDAFVVGDADDASNVLNAAYYDSLTSSYVKLSSHGNAQPCDAFLSSAYDTAEQHPSRLIVGLGWDGCAISQATMWLNLSSAQSLGSMVSGRSSRANAVNFDGSVIAGWQDLENGYRHASIWYEESSMDYQQYLINGPFNSQIGAAEDVSGDGRFVVGSFCGGVTAAWIHDTVSNTTQCLSGVYMPDPNLRIYAFGVSGDGQVVGGTSENFDLRTRNAIVWLSGRPFWLEDLLFLGNIEYENNWSSFSVVTAVSEDGKVVAGYGFDLNGIQRGFVVDLPDFSGYL